MPELSLRYYQEDAVRAAIKSIKRGLNPLLLLPTGAGKSLIIAELTKRLSNKQILVVTPRIKLLQQNAKLIKGAGILSGKLGTDLGDKHRVLCGTYQTLINRDVVEPEIIIIDEAHLIPDDDSEYANLLARYPKALIVGLTATPFRGYSCIYEDSGSRWDMAYEIGLLELIEKDYLVPPKAFKTHIELDADTDSNEGLTKRILPTAANKLAELNRNKTLVFCRDIEHAEFVAAELTSLGNKAYFIHSKMGVREQDEALRLFDDQSEPVFLTSCNMLTTGVDLPAVDSIILIRKISMGALYIQIIGRGLRVFKGKDYCAVLDYGKNIGRFGQLDAPNFLRDIDKKRGSGNRQKHCDNCDLILPLSANKCSHCGYEFQVKTVLNLESSNSKMLSIDLRQSRIISKSVTQAGGVWRVSYHLENGDKPFKFIKNESMAREDEAGMVMYRVSRGVCQVIRMKN